MARKQGFVANRAGIGNILKQDLGIQAALDALAEPMAQKAGGHVDAYTTDRAVRAVVVDGESQAKDGAATKAAGALGLRLS
jgi:hypothetical protein